MFETIKTIILRRARSEDCLWLSMIGILYTYWDIPW